MKECYEFPDYTWEEHFGKVMPSYIPRELFRDYFTTRAEKANVRRWIHFNHIVKYVDCDEEKKFTVRVLDLNTGKCREEQFDYVIVASSHFSTPQVPHFEGIDTFPGRIIHSHDFREGKEFAGQKVLVVGAKYSAEDISLHCKRNGANSVTISYRTKAPNLKWPEGIEELPLLTRIDGREVQFSDGSQRDFDSIILCTGYQHHLTFMADKLRLVTHNRFYPDNLYKGIFWQDQPRLMYLGMQDLALTLTLLEAQSYYARDFILGRLVLPASQDERQDDIIKWQSREKLLEECADICKYQVDYVADLIAATDCAKLNSEQIMIIFKGWLNDRLENIVTMRQQSYPSTITGKMAVPPQDFF